MAIQRRKVSFKNESLTLHTYGRFDHEDWCTHKAAIGTWNLDRRSIKEDKPDTVIDSPCCIMCVEFHPVNPAWLAGGNFNGNFFFYFSSSLQLQYFSCLLFQLVGHGPEPRHGLLPLSCSIIFLSSFLLSFFHGYVIYSVIHSLLLPLMSTKFVRIFNYTYFNNFYNF